MHTMYDFVKERERAMFEEGQIAGEKRGRLEGLQSTAVKMLAMGMDIAMISEATGFTEDEIKKLNDGKALND